MGTESLRAGVKTPYSSTEKAAVTPAQAPRAFHRIFLFSKRSGIFQEPIPKRRVPRNVRTSRGVTVNR